jgi:uncharacterized protein (TIGR03435 family)
MTNAVGLKLPSKLLLFAAALLTFVAPAHSDEKSPAPAFDIADIHVSPHRRFPFMEGNNLRGDRYVIHQATMLDLIAAAYGLDSDLIRAGPAWLETDRFEIVAKAPPTASKDTLKLMLQSLLADRFKLVVHNDTAPMPAYVLSVGKGKPKLKEAEGTGDADCKYQEPPPNLPPGTITNIQFACHHTTMAELASNLHDWAGSYFDKPVVDSTGLKGSYDFDIKWTGRGQLQKAGDDGISIFDAVDKQLGLKLDLQTAPRPVLLVDSVNQKPTPNAQGIERILPPLPPAQFEVATIKPSKPDQQLRARINGNQVDAQGATLRFLINFAWDLNFNDPEMVANAPKWFDTDKFDILAKVSSDAQATAAQNGQQIDIDDLRHMIRMLIEERFNMKAHIEDQPISAYTLLSVNPKLRKADPLSRTRCKEGPGPDGKDPRIANPSLNRLLTCQNMTMAQICDELQRVAAGYIYTPVLDSTGIQGSWDFTLSFSSADVTQARAAGSGTPSTDGSASYPNGALTLPDAVSRQLGLKLEKQKRPAPVLVIDHIDEKPTEN